MKMKLETTATYSTGLQKITLLLGDYVLYQKSLDTIPARIMEFGKTKVKIRGNFLEGNRETWVSPFNLRAQD